MEGTILPKPALAQVFAHTALEDLPAVAETCQRWNSMERAIWPERLAHEVAALGLIVSPDIRSAVSHLPHGADKTYHTISRLLSPGVEQLNSQPYLSNTLVGTLSWAGGMIWPSDAPIVQLAIAVLVGLGTRAVYQKATSYLHEAMEGLPASSPPSSLTELIRDYNLEKVIRYGLLPRRAAEFATAVASAFEFSRHLLDAPTLDTIDSRWAKLTAPADP